MATIRCPNCKSVLKLRVTKKGGWTAYCVHCNLRVFWTPREEYQETQGQSEREEGEGWDYNPQRRRVRPYKCLICGRYYKTRWGVVRHIRNDHESA